MSSASPLEIQINATANTGDSADLKLNHHFCDWSEGMHQPPDWDDDKACPPNEGPLLMEFIMWFTPWLMAPVRTFLSQSQLLGGHTDEEAGAVERQI